MAFDKRDLEVPRVTAIVPVYNAEDYLEECLACLERETLPDLRVIVMDNASTDRTASIITAVLERDARFSVIRQPFNKGALQNFIDGLAQATTPFVLWRAFDDLSNEGYIEILTSALDRSPDATLAVPRVKSVNLDGSRTRVTPPISPNTPLETALFAAHAGWFYGVWRREKLVPIFHDVITRFPHAWASDHLVLIPVLASHAWVSDPDAEFIQRIKRREGDRPNVHAVSGWQMARMRWDFFHHARALIARHSTDFPSRVGQMRLRLALLRVSGKRVFRLGKILRQFLIRQRPA